MQPHGQKKMVDRMGGMPRSRGTSMGKFGMVLLDNWTDEQGKHIIVLTIESRVQVSF